MTGCSSQESTSTTGSAGSCGSSGSSGAAWPTVSVPAASPPAQASTTR